MSCPGQIARRSVASLGVFLVLVCLIVSQVACSREHPAEAAFRKATEDSSERPLEQVQAELREIVAKWPESKAAEKAESELAWIAEQQAVELSGPALLAWDAVKKVGTAAEKFRLRNGRYPGSFDDLVPKYLDGPIRDPWGFEVVYRRTDRGYDVICYGEDGLPGGVDQATDLLIDTGQVVPPDSGTE